MSIPATTNRSSLHKDIANRIDTAIPFRKPKSLKTRRARECCVTASFAHGSVQILHSLPPKSHRA